MIDFTNCKEELNSYKGSEKKKTLLYENKKYLVKFPDPIRQKKIKLSYINNAFSEYVGSNIFKICGFETQNTILGIYKYNDKKKIVCACEDFTDRNHILYEFENLVLSTNPDKKIETELSDVTNVIEEIESNSKINIILKDNLKEKFWEMFIIDSIIGNTDRHNGNWGILVKVRSKEAKFAPIYDCGSCLNPMLDDSEIKEISESELKNIAINSYSCITENGKKINYMSYIKNMKNVECNNAILKLFDKIDLNKILKFIDSIDCMNIVRKEFYKRIIEIRYIVIEDVYKKLVVHKS